MRRAEIHHGQGVYLDAYKQAGYTTATEFRSFRKMACARAGSIYDSIRMSQNQPIEMTAVESTQHDFEVGRIKMIEAQESAKSGQ